MPMEYFEVDVIHLFPSNHPVIPPQNSAFLMAGQPNPLTYHPPPQKQGLIKGLAENLLVSANVRPKH